jgi:hypothetical protein
MIHISATILRFLHEYPQYSCGIQPASFCRETHAMWYFEYTGGEALGVRKLVRLLHCEYNQRFKGGSFAAALQGALRARAIHAALINALPRLKAC